MNPKSRDAESEHDDAIDAKLDAVLKQRDDPGAHDIPLKRQWDSGLEAELEAALQGFDAATFEVSSPRAGGRSKECARE